MNKSKKAKRLQKEFNYLHDKVEQMEKERDQKGSRDWTMKALITKHKKFRRW